MAENLGRCDKKQYEHCGPHPCYPDVGQLLPPFGCVNWKPEPENEFAEGDHVRLLADIWDDGQEDHHPPNYLARKGEVLIVRKHDPGHDFPYCVSHEGITNGSFRVAANEIEGAN